MSEYEDLYEIAEEAKIEGATRDSIKEQASMEIAMKTFMEEGNFTAFTNNFQDLNGMKQLPGLAAQRLNGGWLWFWCRRRLENCSTWFVL